MSTRTIDINRDKDNDVLYVLKKGTDPNKTKNISANEDVIVRLDARGKATVGLIIENFSKNFSNWERLTDYELAEKFDLFIEMLNNTHLLQTSKS